MNMEHLGPDIFEGALQIAHEEYADLNSERYRDSIESLARVARGLVTDTGRKGIEQLNAAFFDTLGFVGNAEDYYDPRNSYVNDVIDRRTGIPISLATVYCEIGRRLGLEIHGVAFPGHFLVRCESPEGDVIVDCFNGRIMTRKDCQALLDELYEGRLRLTDDMLHDSPPQEILSRMLRNLRNVHAAQGDFARTLRWINMDIDLRPDDLENYRERGLIHARLDQPAPALADLERYAASAPEGPNRTAVVMQISLLRRLLSQMN